MGSIPKSHRALPHYSRRAYSVGVIVSVDDDGPLLVAGKADKLDGFLHSAHFKWRNKVSLGLGRIKLSIEDTSRTPLP